MPNSISVQGYNGVIAGALPGLGDSPPCVKAFLFDPNEGSSVTIRLSPVNAMALASALVGAAEYIMPSSELHEAEEEAYADEVEGYKDE